MGDDFGLVDYPARGGAWVVAERLLRTTAYRFAGLGWKPGARPGAGVPSVGRIPASARRSWAGVAGEGGGEGHLNGPTRLGAVSSPSRMFIIAAASCVMV